MQTHRSSSIVNQTNASLFERNQPAPQEDNLNQNENADEVESNQQQNYPENDSGSESEVRTLNSMPANVDDYIHEQFQEISEVHKLNSGAFDLLKQGKPWKFYISIFFKFS